MSEEKVIWVIKMYLLYVINTKDKVNGQQSNAIFIFIFIFHVFIYLIILNFLMYVDLMMKLLLLPPSGFIKTIWEVLFQVS